MKHLNAQGDPHHRFRYASSKRSSFAFDPASFSHQDCGLSNRSKQPNSMVYGYEPLAEDQNPAGRIVKPLIKKEIATTLSWSVHFKSGQTRTHDGDLDQS